MGSGLARSPRRTPSRQASRDLNELQLA